MKDDLDDFHAKWTKRHPGWLDPVDVFQEEFDELLALRAEVDRLRNTIAANAEENDEVLGERELEIAEVRALADNLADCLASIIPSAAGLHPDDKHMLLQVSTADIRDGIALLERHRALALSATRDKAS